MGMLTASPWLHPLLRAQTRVKLSSTFCWRKCQINLIHFAVQTEKSIIVLSESLLENLKFSFRVY